jgi:hypothetical protein
MFTGGWPSSRARAYGGSVTKYPPQHGYPLTALFVLIAVCAVFSAMLGPVIKWAVRGQIDWEVLLAVTAVSAGVMSALGIAVGLHHHRRAVGAGWGAATGCVAGLLIGPLVVLPIGDFPMLIMASLVGSAMLIGIRMLAQRAS